MPVAYRCARCNTILHLFISSPYGCPTPAEVASMYGGRCPVCGRRLERPTLDRVSIRPLTRREREALDRLRLACFTQTLNCLRLAEQVFGGAGRAGSLRKDARETRTPA